MRPAMSYRVRSRSQKRSTCCAAPTARRRQGFGRKSSQGGYACPGAQSVEPARSRLAGLSVCRRARRRVRARAVRIARDRRFRCRRARCKTARTDRPEDHEGCTGGDATAYGCRRNRPRSGSRVPRRGADRHPQRCADRAEREHRCRGQLDEAVQAARALPRNPPPDHVLVYDAIAADDAAAASTATQTLVDLALEDTRLAMER